MDLVCILCKRSLLANSSRSEAWHIVSTQKVGMLAFLTFRWCTPCFSICLSSLDSQHLYIDVSEPAWEDIIQLTPAVMWDANGLCLSAHARVYIGKWQPRNLTNTSCALPRDPYELAIEEIQVMQCCVYIYIYIYTYIVYIYTYIYDIYIYT